MMADYIVTSCHHSTDNNWRATIRVKIADRAGAEEWLSSYMQTSQCDFRVRTAKKENTKRLVYKVNSNDCTGFDFPSLFQVLKLEHIKNH